MRIVSYNILEGGEGRADPLAEVIEAQRPDLVALVEANCLAVVERIARRLGMDFIVADRDNRASALLSRWPIIDSVNFGALLEGFEQSFLQATVRSPAGTDWVISVIHLPPGAKDEDEAKRLKPLNAVLAHHALPRKAKRRHIICGDFNSNAPYQTIDPGQCKEKTRKAMKKNKQGLPTAVIESMLAAGYIDTYRARHDERTDFVGSFTTQHPGQRVDYIFAFGISESVVKEARVERDRLATFASDHYPIVVEIDEQ